MILIMIAVTIIGIFMAIHYLLNYTLGSATITSLLSYKATWGLSVLRPVLIMMYDIETHMMLRGEMS